MSLNLYVNISSIIIILADLLITFLPRRKFKESKPLYRFFDKFGGLLLMLLTDIIVVGFAFIISLPQKVNVVVILFGIELLVTFLYGLKLYTSETLVSFQEYLNERLDRE